MQAASWLDEGVSASCSWFAFFAVCAVPAVPVAPSATAVVAAATTTTVAANREYRRKRMTHLLRSLSVVVSKDTAEPPGFPTLMRFEEDAFRHNE
jgi:hypothetical protein